MKKNILSTSMFFTWLAVITNVCCAQAPGSFNYQAIARDHSGNPLANTSIGIQASILENSGSGTAVYTETQTVTTTAQGYFDILIGNGTATSGTFNGINWGDGKSKWLQISIDITGGTEYTLTGSSQLVSVPFALYASKSATSGLTATAPLSITSNKIKINPGTNVGDLISWDGNNWVATQPRPELPDTSITIGNIQPYLALNYCIALQGIFPSRNGADPFLGEIELFGFNFNPKGWAFCDGSLMSISQNTALFSLLGTFYGGDGRSTFALPDLRGRIPVNSGQGPGLSNYDVGQTGGTESNTITIHR
ncbi:MAG TPA: tail fiber protein [Chitinophagaceae bacterium]|nr:tail fiber protein [Chitinophagaceae bacterium]